MNLERYEGAVSDFTVAIELGISLPDSYYFRGLAYRGMGNATAAEADFRTACDEGDERACRELSETGR
jgi:hypothetical protein